MIDSLLAGGFLMFAVVITTLSLVERLKFHRTLAIRELDDESDVLARGMHQCSQATAKLAQAFDALASAPGSDDLIARAIKDVDGVSTLRLVELAGAIEEKRWAKERIGELTEELDFEEQLAAVTEP